MELRNVALRSFLLSKQTAAPNDFSRRLRILFAARSVHHFKKVDECYGGACGVMIARKRTGMKRPLRVTIGV
jgi:hypothetical protein